MNNNPKFQQFLKDKQKTINSSKNSDFSDKLDSFIFRNIKALSMGLVETFNNTIFHFFDTVKVRLQAKSMIDDVSLFHKNKVIKKSKNYLRISFNRRCNIRRYWFNDRWFIFYLFKR